MVGQASEKLETPRSPLLTSKEKSLENDISQYLLLHHNYTKPGPDPKELRKSKNKCKKETKTKTQAHNSSKLKKIIPKIPVNIISPSLHVQNKVVKYEPFIESKQICDPGKSSKNFQTSIPTVIKCEPVSECDSTVDLDSRLENTDVIYGTYDEATNCVTIVINEDGTNVSDPEEIILTADNTVSSTSLETYSDSLDLPFLKVSNGGISPLSSSGSDCGYESLGSPTHETCWGEMAQLFPSLL